MTRILPIIALLWLFVSPLMAQSLIKQADRQFDQLAYTKAIELYEQALTKQTAMSDVDRRDARAKLGYSYQQTRDMPNAERVYHDLVSGGDLPADYSKCYLFYAQALASNGKYKEAQAAYDKYGSVQNSDKRAPSFSKLYSDVSALTKNAGSYKVEFLSMNTKRAEFSPVLYKEGLVFVSAGTGGNGIKRVFKWNNTPFLDLYYLPDAQTLRGKASSLGGSKTVTKRPQTRLIRPLGSDDFTAPTANDSKTIGFYGGTNLSLGYEDQPISESDRFSRTLNTKYHEGPATFTKDGSRVIFTRNNFNEGEYRKSSDGVNKLKLYTATQTNGIWSKAEELPFNSDEYSTGHPTLSKDDQLLYFSSDRPGGLGGTDIYVSKWTNGKWSEPVNLGKEVNTKGNELFPFVDEKGNIYFSSDGRPGLGDLDMFYAQLTPDGQQGVLARNLGEPLNSPKDDFGIVTDGDRMRGYFSSNRKNGGADDDVYRFTREGSLYPCRELTVSVTDADSKQPLANTSVAWDNAANDKQKQLKTDSEGLVRICLDVDSDFKFLASHEGYTDSKVGFSTKDLSDDQPSRLEIPLTKPKAEESTAMTTLRGRVTTQTDKTPIAGVKVVLVNDCDGSKQEAITGEDGSYEFSVKPGCNYSLEAMKDNMATMGSRISKEGVGSTDLTMFKKGDVVKIDNIYYNLNKSNIRPDAAVELNKVVDLMKKYPTMTIEMRSHTDSRATAKYNNTLSTSRARAAVAYLKSKGIAAKRMVAKGYGESELLNKCKDGVNCPEEEHQQNRRTEIKILKLD
ncbi:carboxypeptidase regulatory-like domain-containing protein [Spirosoma foliorum]|uniref:Carboxypeptidase regulatory-like domain-containing protein n=1 Tax=Spirosoma foliorum TaxID=2710596 RepID=A0A7G5GXS0_9BACT|nr:carboxypeptidase regulatory-like domain-containing protein [Spirosoma foliorum]QMW03662.1 carboxypeptidase regulatory-like domain-containing protein [Spirosoma foliorum]